MDEKLTLLEQIARTENWIIEGVQFKWADVAFDRSDIIIVLDMPMFRNQFQIIKRFCRQLFGAEPADYKPTLKSLVQILKWSADYRNYERDILIRKLEPIKSKTLFAKGGGQIRAALGITPILKRPLYR